MLKLILFCFRIATVLIEENVIFLRRRNLKMMKSQKMNLMNLWAVISIPMDFSFNQENDQIPTVSLKGAVPCLFYFFYNQGKKNRNWAQISLNLKKKKNFFRYDFHAQKIQP